MTKGNPVPFRFGKNWEKFVKERFSEERVNISKQHILEFLSSSDLKGKYFLDIGCGSGLHSMAAFRAGASRIVSFDYDQDAVDTALKLKKYVGNPQHWEIRKGSILDQEFLRTLDPADIVYAWGMLHHTGAMWKAFENAVGLMKAGSCFYTALYVGDPQFGLPMDFWMDVKRRYNLGNFFTKKRMELWFFWEFYFQKKFGNLISVVQQAREYKRSRGMDMYRDVVDWLGGWPMEYASVQEVEDFAVRKLGLYLVNIKTGEANAEYLFEWPKHTPQNR